MGADAVGIGWSFILHPILCKRIGMAAEQGHGSCMGLRPVKRLRLLRVASTQSELTRIWD
jgi:hypothetical protein